METLLSVKAMQRWSDEVHRRGRRIGFVPTMGYLHAGHVSLVHAARRHADAVVASIFVNPLQFGPKEDLSRYPRDLDGDTRKLTEAGADALFLPDVESMYPPGYQTSVSVRDVTRGLCGESRPTHFEGVTTVVAKLFHAVKPDVAVFGEKDFQQLVAIRRMVEDLNFDIEIVGGPIVREADGLAMSSRNAYLTEAERRAALCLSAGLAEAQALVGAGEREAGKVMAVARARIEAEPLAKVDYVRLVDPSTMAEIDRIEGEALLAVAALFGRTRLIDNRLLNRRTGPGASQGLEPREDSSCAPC